MKKVTLLSGITLLIANLLLGTIISGIGGYNLMVSSLVVIYTTVILYLVNVISLKDGFKVPLLLMFSFIGVISYILSFFAPNRFVDNWWLIIIVILITFETLLLLLTNEISKKIK